MDMSTTPGPDEPWYISRQRDPSVCHHRKFSTAAKDTTREILWGELLVTNGSNCQSFVAASSIQRLDGVESKYTSAAYYKVHDSSRLAAVPNVQSPTSARRLTFTGRGLQQRDADPSDSRVGKLRTKKLKPKTSSSSPSYIYLGSSRN